MAFDVVVDDPIVRSIDRVHRNRDSTPKNLDDLVQNERVGQSWKLPGDERDLHASIGHGEARERARD
jgi:hypothetical protein